MTTPGRPDHHADASPIFDGAATIDVETRRLAAVLATVSPDAPVPTCPQWRASDLLWHITFVHLVIGDTLKHLPITHRDALAIERAQPVRPDGISELIDLREAATAALSRRLRRLDDDTPCWSWWEPDQTVGFHRRMQTFEATMHRVDAELSAAIPVTSIPTEVAAGAVDHAVDVMWGRRVPRGAKHVAHHAVEVHATDTGQSWFVDVGSWRAAAQSTGTPVRGTTAKRRAKTTATATITGPVTQLALWAWTRGGSVRRTGDPQALSALDAVLRQGIA